MLFVFGFLSTPRSAIPAVAELLFPTVTLTFELDLPGALAYATLDRLLAVFDIIFVVLLKPENTKLAVSLYSISKPTCDFSISNTAAVRHLAFLKLEILMINRVHGVICTTGPNFVAIDLTVSVILRFFHFQDGAVHHIVLSKFSILTADRMERDTMYHRAKFCGNRSSHCRDMAICPFFIMAVRHLRSVVRMFGPSTKSIWWPLSLYKIWLGSIQQFQ